MVKLFGYTLRNPFHIEEAVSHAKSADTAPGLFSRSKRDLYRVTEVQSYFDAYTDSDLVRGPIDDLVESALGQGYYTTVEKDTDAKELVDQFGKHFNLDELLVNVGKLMMVGGFCPVETKWGLLGDLEDAVIKIVHPKTVKDIETEDKSQEPLSIKRILQKDQQKWLSGKQLAWFTYGRVGNDPKGMSYVRGLINILNTMNMATDNMDAIMDRYIAPIIIWKLLRSRDLDAFRRSVVEREPGDDIYMGDLTPEELSQELAQIIQFDPDVPFGNWIEYLDRRIYSYVRSNNTWYSKDATVASAETIDTIVNRHVRTLQRNVKRAVERYWYGPLVSLNRLSEIPKLLFGEEPTGVEEIQIEPFLTAGLTTFDKLGPYLTREQYYALLTELGVKVTPPSSPAQPVPGSAKPDEVEDPVTQAEQVWMVKKLVADEPVSHDHSSG